MFILKRITNFQKHRYFYIHNNEIVVITSSTVEIFSKELELLRVIDIKDRILCTIQSNTILIMTPTHFIDIETNYKCSLMYKYTKMHKYKDKILFVGKKRFAFYACKNDKLLLEWEFLTSFEDLIVNDTDIYLVKNNNVSRYEYYNKILLKKEDKIKLINSTETKNEKTEMSIPARKNLIFIDSETMILVSELERHFVYKDILVIICKDKTLYFNTQQKTFINKKSHSNLPETKNIEELEKYKITFCNEKESFYIINNSIQQTLIQQDFQVIKQPHLINIKNYKINFEYKKMHKPVICKNSTYKTANFFIFRKKINLAIETTNFIVVASDDCIYRYKKKEGKVEYLGKIIIEELLFSNSDFLYYSYKKSYFIFDVCTQCKIKYKNLPIIDIIRNKQNIAIVLSNCVKIYKINKFMHKKEFCDFIIKNEQDFYNINYNLYNANNLNLSSKDGKYFLCQNENKIEFNSEVYYFYIDDAYIYIHYANILLVVDLRNIKKILWKMEVKDKNIICNRIYKSRNEVSECSTNTKGVDVQVLGTSKMQLYNELMFINCNGIRIYKSSKLYKQDPISRNVISFYVCNNKIYINDISQYIVILDLDFTILGMIFIGEYILNYYSLSNTIYLSSDFNNKLRIEEKDTKEKSEYFPSNVRLNFVQL